MDRGRVFGQWGGGKRPLALLSLASLSLARAIRMMRQTTDGRRYLTTAHEPRRLSDRGLKLLITQRRARALEQPGYLVLRRLTGRWGLAATSSWHSIKKMNQLEGKYSLESTDPRESEIRAHLRP